MVATSRMPSTYTHHFEVLTSMLIDPATRQSGSWEAENPHDRAMLALQYLVAFIAVAAALLLSSLH
ncbi:MAG TPA: hypothetical protein VF253_03915 [Candidatus Limnocylindrales bacterium]|jgi:hypothetical protein